MPITAEQLRQMLDRHSELDPFEVRNAAMLLVTFSAGWRRSETSALDLADVSFVPQGLTLWQAYSKSDQTGKGRLVGIDKGKRKRTCPVRALKAWLALRGAWPGPLFTRILNGGRVTEQRLSDEAVYRIVKSGLERIGVDPGPYGARSLRSGFVTCAAENGATEVAIQMRTG